jgi:hypothetical protein
MTERTIKHLAIELAGKFYDTVRSAEKAGEKVQIRQSSTGRTLQQIDPRAFGKTFPTEKDYIAGRRHGRVKHQRDGSVFWVDTGEVYEDTPGWLHWYDMARQMLVEMLGRPDISEHRKKQIFDAIVEDREKQMKQEAMLIKSPQITQRHSLEPRN